LIFSFQYIGSQLIEIFLATGNIVISERDLLLDLCWNCSNPLSSETDASAADFHSAPVLNEMPSHEAHITMTGVAELPPAELVAGDSATRVDEGHRFGEFPRGMMAEVAEEGPGYPLSRTP
jgi:hypothetical protein